MGTAVMNLLVQMQSALADYRDNWVAPCVEFDGGDPDQLASIEALIAKIDKAVTTPKPYLFIHLDGGIVQSLTVRNGHSDDFSGVEVLDSDVNDYSLSNVVIDCDGTHCFSYHPPVTRNDQYEDPTSYIIGD